MQVWYCQSIILKVEISIGEWYGSFIFNVNYLWLSFCDLECLSRFSEEGKVYHEVCKRSWRTIFEMICHRAVSLCQRNFSYFVGAVKRTLNQRIWNPVVKSNLVAAVVAGCRRSITLSIDRLINSSVCTGQNTFSRMYRTSELQAAARWPHGLYSFGGVVWSCSVPCMWRGILFQT